MYCDYTYSTFQFSRNIIWTEVLIELGNFPWFWLQGSGFLRLVESLLPSQSRELLIVVLAQILYVWESNRSTQYPF